MSLRIGTHRLEKILPTVKKSLLKIGIDAQHGDCGSFAVALGEVLGSNTYMCSFENEGFAVEGEPAHCAVQWKGNLWDSKGKITKKNLKERAFNEAFPEDEPNILVEVAKDPHAFREVYDKKKATQIKAILVEFT